MEVFVAPALVWRNWIRFSLIVQFARHSTTMCVCSCVQCLGILFCFCLVSMCRFVVSGVVRHVAELEPWFISYILQYKLQYIPRNVHTVFALLCFVVVIHRLIFPYPSVLLHWHCGNLTIAPVPAKQPWWIWIDTSCEFIMNDCITTTKQSTTKPCAYFLGYTVDD